MKKGMKEKKKINWKLLIICFVLTYGIGLVGSIFTYPNVHSAWYTAIKPDITPPNSIFPIAWNILFFMIAVSLYAALRSTKDSVIKSNIWTVFGINFILNALWSFFYFGLRNPPLAFGEIIFLEISIFAMISVLWKVNKISVWLLVPYSLWIGFAAILNYLSAFG
jgi:translocator protein